MTRPGPHVLAACWLAFFGVLQWSVVRFRVSIVLTLTVCAIALTIWLVRRLDIALTRSAAAVALCGSAAIVMSVPLFSYLPTGWEFVARAVLAVAAVVAAATLVVGRPGVTWAAAVVGHVVASVVAILSDPSPKIDVWVTLQQASDALARGDNFYSVTWVASPGVQDAFTYLPWTAVLVAPGRWVAGDVRWMHLVWVLVLAAGIWALGRPAPGHDDVSPRAQPAPRSLRAPGRPAPESGAGPRSSHGWAAAAGGALLLLAPGTLTQIDQAWTEPLLLTGIVWWAVLVRRGRAWWSVIPLAIACASKQHLALLLPLLLVWQAFGWRRALATGALTGALIAPWFLTAPADFVHDTITLLVGFHPITFANTWYLLALNEFGVTLPFWLTGIAVLGTLAASLVGVARRQPPLEELLRWTALVLLVANLVNKQAFYNQYWLVGGLLALSVALTPSPAAPDHGGEPAPTTPLAR